MDHFARRDMHREDTDVKHIERRRYPRPRREFGENPDAAVSRPVSEVEGYQQ